MAFIKKQWTARQGVGLNKFSIDGKPAVTLVNRPDSVLVPGDAFSEENMNDLENRIANALGTVYGDRIDRTNSNPYTSVEYTDNAVGFTPSSGNNGNFIAGSWGDKYPFNKLRPCLLKNGNVVGYLDKNNYAQFENGTAADITSGAAGDVMIEIPKVYYKITQDSRYTYVQISDNPIDKMANGFSDYAHSYKGVVKDKFYVGAYTGFVDAENKLRSLSGKIPTANKTIGAFRIAAQANGAGYEQLAFNKLVLLQILYLIRYKSIDSQSALGTDYVSASGVTATGATNTRGMNYGANNNTISAKCNGIENLWGNLLNFVDGYKATANSVKIADGNFNDNGDGYIEHSCKILNAGGYVKSIGGDNALGFTPQDLSGSSTTYYSDWGDLYSGCLPCFGGCFGNGGSAGAFKFDCGCSTSSADANVGARLLFCN